MIYRDPKCVFVGNNFAEAEAVVVRLGHEGIPAQVMNSATLGGLDGLTHWSATGVAAAGIEVWVNDPDDVPRATRLLNEQKAALVAARSEEKGPVAVECDECGQVTDFPARDRNSVQSCPNCGAFLDVEDEDGGSDREEGGPPEDEDGEPAPPLPRDGIRSADGPPVTEEARVRTRPVPVAAAPATDASELLTQRRPGGRPPPAREPAPTSDGEAALATYRRGMKTLGAGLLSLGVLQGLGDGLLLTRGTNPLVLVFLAGMAAFNVVTGVFALAGRTWVNYVVAVSSALLLLLNGVGIVVQAQGPGLHPFAILSLLIPGALLYVAARNLSALAKAKAAGLSP
jgi:Putative prokaryotic signal transducing protein